LIVDDIAVTRENIRKLLQFEVDFEIVGAARNGQEGIELAKELQVIGIKIAKEAWDFAMHAGRKTIKAEDIEIASKKVMEK